MAPGESTRSAVIDWTRKTAAQQHENTTKTDSLSNDVTQDRAINEVTSATAKEAQSGFSASNVNSTSTQKGSSFAGEASSPFGGLLGGISGSTGETSSQATSNTSADGYSVSTAQRDIGSTMTQNVNDRTQRNAHDTRGRRASVVREVSESEKESVSTRVIANYNHMHALNIQYYEVVQIYKTKVAISRADRVLFIPVKMTNFEDDSLIRRFKTVLMNASPTFESRDAISNLDVVQLDPPFQTNFTRFGGITIDKTLNDGVLRTNTFRNIPGLANLRPLITPATVPPPTPAPAGADAAAQPPPGSPANALNEFRISNKGVLLQHIASVLWDPAQASRLSGMLGRSILRPRSPTVYLPTDTTIVGSYTSCPDAIISETSHLATGVSAEAPSPTNGVLISDISSVTIKGGNPSKDTAAVAHLTLSRNGITFPLDLPELSIPKATTAEITVVSAKSAVSADVKKFL